MEACVILGHTKLQPVKQEASPFKGGEKSLNKDTLLNLLSNIQNDLISTIGIGGIAIDLAITHFPTTV